MSVCFEKSTNDTGNSKCKNKYKGLETFRIKIESKNIEESNESVVDSNEVRSYKSSSTGNSVIYRSGQ